MREIIPVILSGGTGSRLWPLSRETYPKQLLPLIGPNTLLQDTILRIADLPWLGRSMIVANDEHRFVVAEQLRTIKHRDAMIILEPFGRNTCPAAAVAALLAMRENPESIMPLMPADHRYRGRRGVQGGDRNRASRSQRRRLRPFSGSRRQVPATGYGYINRGETIRKTGTAQMCGFVEKPDRVTAEAYLASGEYLWNSGIVMLRLGNS